MTERLRAVGEAQAAAGGGDEVARTVVRRVVEADAVDPAGYRNTEGRLWIVSVDGEISNDDCREGDGVIRPRFLADRRTGPRPTGKARDPCDRSREVARADGERGVVTRT
ncbi:hypothetical protein GCM10019016_059680 [Streptomyces prasinosporus]|uniref:Uncharacterized protein n=1 Tax=Streptomyces prasinosporus TaxID=68256 RepID=A0ABP6TU94_9ACTN